MQLNQIFQIYEKKVVIKRILPHLQHDSYHVEMFLDEARLAARFNHPSTRFDGRHARTI